MDKTNLTRIRDNQRRSRARRKEYVQDLEKRLRLFERQGIEASSEIQQAARKVADENKKLRALLYKHGFSNEEIGEFLRTGELDLPSSGRSYTQPPDAPDLFVEQHPLPNVDYHSHDTLMAAIRRGSDCSSIHNLAPGTQALTNLTNHERTTPYLMSTTPPGGLDAFGFEPPIYSNPISPVDAYTAVERNDDPLQFSVRGTVAERAVDSSLRHADCANRSSHCSQLLQPLNDQARDMLLEAAPGPSEQEALGLVSRHAALRNSPALPPPLSSFPGAVPGPGILAMVEPLHRRHHDYIGFASQADYTATTMSVD
ncbi:hypothetical protein GGR56DRAFT_188974 [Xylariaceae sp. FL0804]|nr:hypothetical protein GGR56DRAFT_188974 [Xylariaceae sp. FL0804]